MLRHCVRNKGGQRGSLRICLIWRTTDEIDCRLGNSFRLQEGYRGVENLPHAQEVVIRPLLTSFFIYVAPHKALLRLVISRRVSRWFPWHYVLHLAEATSGNLQQLIRLALDFLLLLETLIQQLLNGM